MKNGAMLQPVGSVLVCCGSSASFSCCLGGNGITKARCSRLHLYDLEKLRLQRECRLLSPFPQTHDLRVCDLNLPQKRDERIGRASATLDQDHVASGSDVC